MTFVHYAIVSEQCPACGQGAVFVAAEKDGKTFYVICDDCEAEWDDPDKLNEAKPADRDKHSFLRFIECDELKYHPWYCFVLNKGSDAWR
jgi:uncharacterized Zn finger protein (UPF0148 family)